MVMILMDVSSLLTPVNHSNYYEIVTVNNGAGHLPTRRFFCNVLMMFLKNGVLNVKTK